MTRCVYTIFWTLLISSLVGCVREEEPLFNKKYASYCDFFQDFAQFTLQEHVYWGPEKYEEVTQRALNNFLSSNKLEVNGEGLCSSLEQAYQNQDDIFGSEEEYYQAFLQAYLHTLDPHSRYIIPELVQIDRDRMENKLKRSGVEYYYRNRDIATKSKNNPVWVDYVHKNVYPGLTVGSQVDSVENHSIIGLSSQKIFDLINSKLNYSIGIDSETFTINHEKGVFPSSYINIINVDGAQVAWVRLLSFTKGSADHIIRTLHSESHVDAIVMDLRGNGGGWLYEAHKLMDYFLPKKHIYSEVNYNSGDTEKYSTTTASKNNTLMTVLIDSGSASASEIFAGAMGMLGRAKIVGNYSYGKMSSQRLYTIGEKNGIGGEFFLTRSFLIFADETTAQYHRITPHVWFKDPEASLIDEGGRGFYEHQLDMALKPNHSPTSFETNNSFEIESCPVENLRECTHRRIASFALQ